MKKDLKSKDPVLTVVVTGYLTSARVESIFKDCLFREDELVAGLPIVPPLFVEGIVRKIGFNPKKIDKHKKEIEMLLENLSDEFLKGASFLGLCYDKAGSQWTGLHMVMEQLVCLGLAIEAFKYCSPRNTWLKLPGGFPYIERVTNKEIKINEIVFGKPLVKKVLPDIIRERVNLKKVARAKLKPKIVSKKKEAKKVTKVQKVQAKPRSKSKSQLKIKMKGKK